MSVLPGQTAHHWTAGSVVLLPSCASTARALCTCWVDEQIKERAACGLFICSQGLRPTCESEKCLGVNLSFQQKMGSLLHSPKNFTVDFKPGHIHPVFFFFKDMNCFMVSEENDIKM